MSEEQQATPEPEERVKWAGTTRERGQQMVNNARARDIFVKFMLQKMGEVRWVRGERRLGVWACSGAAQSGGGGTLASLALVPSLLHRPPGGLHGGP